MEEQIQELREKGKRLVVGLKAFNKHKLVDIADWIRGNRKSLDFHTQQTGFSPSVLSVILNKELSGITKDGKYTLGQIHGKLLRLIPILEKMLDETRKGGGTEAIKENYKTRDRGFTTNFVKEKLMSIYAQGGKVELDAFGIKLSSVKMALEWSLEFNQLPELKARLLFLHPESPGAKIRRLIENSEVQNTTNRTIHNALRLKHLVERYDANTNIGLRSFQFNPMVYMIRINDVILASTYLATRGYFGSYEIYQRGGQFFKGYMKLFERVFNDDELSQAIPDD